MRMAADRMAKATGRSLFDILLGFAYDESLSVKDRQASVKLYLDKMMISVSEGGEADKNAGPAVFLPEMRPNLELVDGGKKAG